jgi:hypothetical protein
MRSVSLFSAGGIIAQKEAFMYNSNGCKALRLEMGK